MTERKATDILLSIERELSTLSKRIQNVENLQKILVKKFNESKEPAVPPVKRASEPAITRDNFDNRPKTNKFSQMAMEVGVDIEEEKPLMETFVARPSDLPPDPNGDDMIESPGRTPARGQRGPKNNNKKSSISQVLTKGDTPLFLANIEVLDKTGQMINQTRTNTKGRWLMALAPGEYQVHVVKRFPPDSGKESVDTKYQIQVPPSDKPMELDQLSL